MSKKIIYWTGVYSPDNEAVSKEILLLHNHFPRSFVYGIARDFFKFSLKKRYLVHFYRPYRLAPKFVPVVEKKFDISHIYHSLDNWYFLEHLEKKPIILTGATGGKVLDRKKYKKIEKIVVESEYDLMRVKHGGIEEEKIKLIYPGLDLSKFSYTAPKGDFSILFASSPFAKEYFAARGVDLLLSATERCKDVHFILLWRKWAGTVKVIKTMVTNKKNVTLNLEVIKDISLLLNKVHAVIAPFTSQQLTKPCPHSVIESLAAGKPVLVSDKVGIARIIQENNCGVVFKPDKEDLVRAIDELKRNYTAYQKNARRCAEEYFSKEIFLKQYELIYNTLL
ncbi:MAG: glycosyltransferase family 4 protein [Deltaproteobacteria bacterium]|nr:glycosyltransferase family 4 protein [Deltaproteobacteria bacterium]